MKFINKAAARGETESEDDIGWLLATPEPGQPELADEEIPISPELPFVAEVRRTATAIAYILPDSAEPVPPDIFAGIDADKVVSETARSNKKLADIKLNGVMVLLPNELKHLEDGGDAAKKLLATLKRGLEATTPQLRAAADARLCDSGLR